MTRHSIKWYKPGRKIVVNDKMQENYSYVLSEPAGKHFHPDFKPELSPEEILKLGVFEGKYINDGEHEFPREWYKNTKTSKVANPSINFFKIKSRLSLQEWIKRRWIPITEGDNDIRGWFQWYCRYWIGRRDPNVDMIQIKRWKSFKRHKAQILKSIQRLTPLQKRNLDIMKHRPKQRQALLQWAYNPMIKK